MDRREFMRATAALASVGAVSLSTGVEASLLPANPVFGRTFTNLRDQTVAMSDYRGQPILMNFWASWCAPCVREMPFLESLHHDHPDLVVLGMAVDTKANVQRFLQKLHISYPILLTGTDGIGLMRDLGNKMGGLPFTVLFGTQGRIRDTLMGELKPDAADRWISQVL